MSSKEIKLLQKQQELRYRKENPLVTTSYDHTNEKGEQTKHTGSTVLASGLWAHVKSTAQNGFYLSLNNSAHNTRDNCPYGMSAEKYCDHYYTMLIDIDKSDIYPFNNLPIKLSSIEKCTNGLGYHAEIFIDVTPFNQDSKIQYHRAFNIIQAWFELKGIKIDSTKDAGRFCRIPYSPHNKPGKEDFYYEITYLEPHYYSLDELEAAFQEELTADNIYRIKTSSAKPVNPGERQDILYKKAISFYGAGMPAGLLVEYLYKFSTAFCTPQHTNNDRAEISRQARRAVEYIDKNGGPKDIMAQIKETPLFRLDQGGFVDRLKHYLPEGAIIYNRSNKSWYKFKGKYWVDNRFPLYSVISEIIEDNMTKEKEIAALKKAHEMATSKSDPEAIKKAVNHIEKQYDAEMKAAHSAWYKEAVLKQLADQPGFCATEDIKDVDLPIFNQIAHKFNFANGTFNFNTFELEPTDWTDYSTVSTRYEYKAGVESPKFEQFLEEILYQGDPDGKETAELLQWMQIFLGSCFIGGENKNKVFPVWYGMGNNGKSTLISILAAIYGEYAGSIRAEALASKSESNRFELSDIPNKRLVIANESDERATLKVAFVKAMTGNDVLKCERKGAGHFDFTPAFKLVLVTNNKPTITERTEAIWSRVKLIPFNVVIAGDRVNPNLKKEILEEEAAGVINWLIEGARKWVTTGYKLPDCTAIKTATEEYQNEEDIITNWIDEYCEIMDTPKSGDSVKNLFTSFSADTKSRLGQKQFSRELEKRGFIKQKVRSYQFNLRLLNADANYMVNADGELFDANEIDYNKVNF